MHASQTHLSIFPTSNMTRQLIYSRSSIPTRDPIPLSRSEVDRRKVANHGALSHCPLTRYHVGGMGAKYIGASKQGSRVAAQTKPKRRDQGTFSRKLIGLL